MQAPGRHAACLAAALLAACAAFAPGRAGAQAASPPAAVSPSQPISSAETLLFETDNLAGIKAPAVLLYDFRKASNIEPGFNDKVRLELTSAKGKTNTTLHFLSGERAYNTPPLEDAHGNPVLLGFLERDIAEMRRLTGGSTAYFRKRIRMALADNAQVTKQTITYEGKSVPAQAVRIQPYRDDPMHERFEPYVQKTYLFILSDQVPGGIYQLRSTVANGGGNRTVAARAGQAAPPVLPEIDETMTLTGVTHPGR